MPQPFEKAHRIIRDHEEKFAYSLAKQVIEKPQASVWLVFLPILLVFHFQRLQKYKDGIHSFARGVMRSKLLILDAALEEAKTGVFHRERVISALTGLLSDEKAAAERGKKSEEMEILRQHYLLLLENEGSSYGALLRNAYGSSGDYRLFLNRLHKAEKEVNAAIVQISPPTSKACEVVERMENLSEKLREMEFKEIFGQ
jgi:hypothetical protein